MKKLLAILVAVILCCAFVVPASAAVPTALTFTQIETSKAPALDGTVDASYGAPVFDFSAKELKVGDKNLFMTDVLEDGSISDSGTYGANDLSVAKFANTYNTMRTVAYITYDDKNLYLAFDTTDIAPKASADSSKPWRSTNFQLCLFVNQRKAFFTVAYTGKNKATIANDTRNEFDIDIMKVAFNEKSQSNFVYELVIPWTAAPGLKSAKDVEDFRFGYAQSSMAEAYNSIAVGEAWHQDYDKLIPVTMKNLAGGTTGGNTSTTTSTTTSTVVDDSDAPQGGGTQINTGSDKDTASDDEGDKNTGTTGATEEVIVVEDKDNSNVIIILCVLAGVVLIGGVVAIILLNKKPADKAQ